MPYILRYLLSLLWVCTLFSSQAQKTNHIKGQTVGEDKQAIPYVSILLYRVKDGTLASTAASDSTGNFRFTNLKAGTYFIKVKSLTHQDTFSPHFRLEEHFDEYDLGKILLLQNNAYLAEVVVERKKQFIEQQQDKLVFNIENSTLADGNNGLELLSKIPGVAVDESGSLSIKGKSGATVMINGKITYLSADQLANLLRSTSSMDINKIEVMSNPNAKQDAAGSAGIINIVLKKGLKQGFNGSVSANAGAGRGAHLGGSLNLNYRTEKINVFGIYNQYFQNLEYYNSLTRYFYTDRGSDPDSYSQQENTIQPKLRSNNFRVGMDYSINSKQTIGFLINGGFGKYPKYEPTTNSLRNFNTDNLISASTTVTEGKERWRDMLYNFNYNLKLNDKGHELKLDLDFVDHYSKMDQQLNTAYHNVGPSTSLANSSRIGDIPSDNQVYVAKLDYTLPLPKEYKLEAGWKSSDVRTENDLHYDTLQNDQYVPDLGTSNHFIYKETIHAGYVNLSKSWHKFSTQLGIRGEYTRTRSHQITLNEQFERSYFKLFPAAFLTYTANDNHKVQTSYSYRVQRPSFWDLNPFRVYTDPFSYAEGNSNLNPAYEHSFELAYTYASKYVLTLNYAQRSNVVNGILGRDPLNPYITFERPENIGSFKNYGISFIAPTQLTSWWSATHFANYYRNEYELPQEDELIIRKGNTLSLNSQNSFKLPEGWSIELGGNYVSGLTVGISHIKSYGQVYSGIQKNLLNKKATLKLVVNDIFRTNNRRYETISPTIRLIGRSNPDSRTAILSFSYRFGGSQNATAQRATGSEDIKSRL
ncbi:outer membrane beta-barrel family protein [Sphingobacterium athyrii]|uniref:TonB-dependent receptor n=1 Tax=Sphingobacterium athyrii TaxID=2152717 RepID=A0A363NMI9_9SPHI|nr:outer membrane beta-barrel family protein [Sphingobacterium athyrii]PUV22028.1 TonB-dependent receptor [Sphingobacterium athyrii]